VWDEKYVTAPRQDLHGLKKNRKQSRCDFVDVWMIYFAIKKHYNKACIVRTLIISWASS